MMIIGGILLVAVGALVIKYGIGILIAGVTAILIGLGIRKGTE